MTYVQIDINDWTKELQQHLRELFDGVDKCKALIELYIPWANTYYRRRIVRLPTDMASVFYQNAEMIFRDEEDKFLMDEMKTRTTPMFDNEWQEYCKSKDAIIIKNDCALLTDGYFDNKKQI